MEYVDGVPSSKGLEITRKLCAGLAAAHGRAQQARRHRHHGLGLAAIADELSGNEARSGRPGVHTAYELFTGRRAFEADSVIELLEAEQISQPVPIAEIAPDVDPVIEEVILRCLQPDPRQRPPRARAIAAGLPGGDPLALALAAGASLRRCMSGVVLVSLPSSAPPSARR
jgi:hypothetical protein